MWEEGFYHVVPQHAGMMDSETTVEQLRDLTIPDNEEGRGKCMSNKTLSSLSTGIRMGEVNTRSSRKDH